VDQQATASRILDIKRMLESAVTAALPLSAHDAEFRERMAELEKSVDMTSPTDYFEGYQDLGMIAKQRSKSDEDFKYALTVLGVDPNSDYGLSVMIAAAQTSNLVVIVSRLLGCTPEEVWHNYLLEHDSPDEV
jgi:hypothetical protein